MTKARGGRASDSSLQVEIAWSLPAPRSGPTLLRKVGVYAARAEGFRAGVISIAVVGQRAMRTLHREHMRIDTPTDVLTFDLGTDRKCRWIEGEIVICRDVAERVVRPAVSPRGLAKAVARELALYVVHGILHLSGYQDSQPATYRRMHTRENQILTQLSLGKVFGEIT